MSMREIDFIAMMYNKDRWVRGCLVKRGSYHIESDKEKGRVMIRKETLSQFTGFVTKGGKRIYENMVLRFVNKECPYWFVVFRKGCFMLQSATTVPDFHTFDEWKETIIEDAIIEGTVFDIEQSEEYRKWRSMI